jgi:hypothetical protein
LFVQYRIGGGLSSNVGMIRWFFIHDWNKSQRKQGLRK